jgi:hypothetical protein
MSQQIALRRPVRHECVPEHGRTPHIGQTLISDSQYVWRMRSSWPLQVRMRAVVLSYSLTSQISRAESAGALSHAAVDGAIPYSCLRANEQTTKAIVRHPSCAEHVSTDCRRRCRWFVGRGEHTAPIRQSVNSKSLTNSPLDIVCLVPLQCIGCPLSRC